MKRKVVHFRIEVLNSATPYHSATILTACDKTLKENCYPLGIIVGHSSIKRVTCPKCLANPRFQKIVAEEVAIRMNPVLQILPLPIIHKNFDSYIFSSFANRTGNSLTNDTKKSKQKEQDG
jgi:hypothetical protein